MIEQFFEFHNIDIIDSEVESWTFDPMFTGSSYFSVCNGMKIVGGYDRFGQNVSISKTLNKALPHCFNIYFEHFVIYLRIYSNWIQNYFWGFLGWRNVLIFGWWKFDIKLALLLLLHLSLITLWMICIRW